MPGQGMPAALQQMAAPRVEARSLSQLNYLASNPPKYPVNPTEAKQPPLTLYISRVPGSRDVILSPFKPQLKNVTGEDIANSFYLIHLDLPSDELLLARSQDAHGGSPTSHYAPSIASAHSPIARKPLPASAKFSAPLPVPPASEAPAQAPVPPPVSRAGQTGGSDVLRVEQPALGRPGQEARSPKNVSFGPDLSYPNRYGDLPADRPTLPPRPDSQTALPSQQPEGPMARKPLGPRSLEIPHQPPILHEDAPRPLGGGKFDGLLPSQTLGADHSSSFPTPVPSPKPPPAQLVPEPKPQPESHKFPSPPRSPSPAKRELVPFTLTLIRRDPVTGNQWNVGKVSSFQQSAEAPVADDRATDATSGPTVAELAGVAPPVAPTTRNPGSAPPAVNIRIETSGYAKFRGMYTTRESLDIGRNRTGSASSSVFRGVQGGIAGNSSADSLSLEYFTRQLLMGYTKSWTTNIRDHLRSSKNRSNSVASEHETSVVGAGNRKNPTSPLEAPPRPPFHARPSSAGSAGSGASFTSPHGSPLRGMTGLQALQKNLDSHMESSSHNQAHSPGGNPIVTAPGPGLRPRGYVFASPWDGLCEFRTSSSGRGVKCVHSLGGCVGATNNDDGSPTSPQRPPATLVSELRFNLPSADLFRDKGLEIHGKLDRLRLDAQRTLAVHGHHRGSRSLDHSPSHDFPDPFETEMGLGRERAGGGNRGKRAKLGKLIIYDEGLKMLDLVVAANMGVWWGAWERSF